jgi:organic radical activating enzyme
MDEMKNLSVQASDLGTEGIVLTGGEPTLIKHDELCDYFRFIKDRTNISNIRIVTNGYWAKSYEKAYSVLKDWKEAGLDELNVSCGEFHQEFVPIENIEHAYKAGCDLDFKTVLLAGEFTKSKKENKLTPYDFEKMLGCRIKQHKENSQFVTKNHLMTCNSALSSGRGKQYIKLEDIPLIKYENLPNICNSVVSGLSFHPDGLVTLCCGVGVRDVDFLNIGNWREERLQMILNRSNDDLYANLIKFYGLKTLKEKLMATHPELGLTHKLSYFSLCELCFEIFTNGNVLNYFHTNNLELEDELISQKIIQLSTIYSSKYVY